MTDPDPHFSTFGKNYTRRFKGTDLLEQIFTRVLEECYSHHLIDTKDLFIDSAHAKACANNKKIEKKLIHQEALFCEKQPEIEINADREDHGKKPLKNKDDHHDDPGGGRRDKEGKTSKSDPEGRWFHKADHKQVFAYEIETVCNKNGWILGYDVNPGNEHDSCTFSIYDKIRTLAPETIIVDAGYKTPAIAKMLIDDGIAPLFPYKRPMTKEGFFKKYEYVYDEYYDCCLCPNNQVLNYSTTNREGYREYKSDPRVCGNCPYLSQCTQSKNHVKLVYCTPRSLCQIAPSIPG